MTAQRWTLIKSIFSRALEIERSERGAWVRQQENLPPNIVEEVLRLLQADDQETALRSPADPPPQPSRLPLGEVLLSRFEIQEYLGCGAMGDVYRAFDRTLHEAIAIKTLRSHLVGQPNLIERLRREVHLARRIRHANVCQILEFHQDLWQNSGTLTFFTMELLEGETLAARIGRGPLTEPEVFKLARDMADGLQAIHVGSLVHRDLKPSNVFLVSAGDATGVRAVITDFGLCFDERVVTESLTLFGPNAIVGTPAYMSPEQLLAKGATKKSDVYAFGVVLFEMVTGRLPFEGETPLAIAMRRLQGNAPTPRSFAPDLPAHWEKVILACLERDPANRPASATEVIEGLTGERAFSMPRRMTRRQMWALGATGTAALLAGAASINSLWSGRAQHVPDVRALRHFKLGQEFAKQTSPDAITSAITEFEQAVSIDAKYAEAWAEMADAYCMASTYNAIPSRIARKKAESMAKQALSLDASLSKAHAAYAYALATDLKRWRSAEESFRRAISLSPNEPLVRSWYAAYLGRAGRFLQAIVMAESALEIEPGVFQYGYRLATELLRGRQYDRLLTHMKDLVRLHPAEASAFWTLGRTYEWLKRFDDAEAALKYGAGLPNKSSSMAFWATLCAAKGDITGARKWTAQTRKAWLAEKQETNSYLSVLGSLAMKLGAESQIDEILRVFQEGIRREDETVLAAATNAYLDPVKNDERYRQLLRDLNFV